jgi:hypothetical protein|tara:strand:+ start:1008 stop:1715 length:708 start_codon:yes stop_codon:yes gene_type:complete
MTENATANTASDTASSMTSDNLSAGGFIPGYSDPYRFETQGARWWRTPCLVNDDMLISGDLHHSPEKASVQLKQWQEAGVTHIIDCRNEWSDLRLVNELAPSITYYEHGTHDAGGDQDDLWYTHGWQYYQDAMSYGDDQRVMIHCHMGINRAPSMAFYILLELGRTPTQALTEIRTARPIAACYYAISAWHTYSRAHGLRASARAEGLQEIEDYYTANRINLSRVIHEVRRVEHD